MTKSRQIRKPRKQWTDPEIELLCRDYPNSSTAALARTLNCTLTQVYNMAHKLGLAKSPAFIAATSRDRMLRPNNPARESRFPKGHVPANKGLRRPGWTAGDMAKTQFKKGRPAHEAHNYVPIGSYRISKDGTLERKVTDDPTIFPVRRWVGVHRLVWMEANGPIPPKHVVAFKPGRHTTELALITLDALELMTMADNMRRNSFHRYGKEVVKVVQLRGAITRQINKRAKLEEPHEQ